MALPWHVPSASAFVSKTLPSPAPCRYACIFALQASLHSDPSDTWVGAEFFDLCGDYTEDDPYTGSPGPLPGCESLQMGSWYLAAFSWAAMVITGTGGTEGYPSAISNGETLIVTTLVVVGAILWSMVLALLIDVLANSQPALKIFYQRLDGLNMYIRMHGVPTEMARRLRGFMHQQKLVQLHEDSKIALPHLSPALQVEVILWVESHWLQSIWFIRELEAPVKVRLAMSMLPKVLTPGEDAPNRHLYIISRGSVMFGGRVLGRGKAWGDDVVLLDTRAILPYLARALIYTDVVHISHGTFQEIVAVYPKSLRILRKHAIKLALRRVLVHLSKQAKMEKDYELAKERLGRKAKRGNDLMDRIFSAAESALTEEQHSTLKDCSSGSLISGSVLARTNSVGVAAKELQDLEARLSGKFEHETKSMREAIKAQGTLMLKLADHVAELSAKLEERLQNGTSLTPLPVVSPPRPRPCPPPQA